MTPQNNYFVLNGLEESTLYEVLLQVSREKLTIFWEEFAIVNKYFLVFPTHSNFSLNFQAYNDLGSSEPSPVVLARTREAAPGAGPTGVSAEATSSTTILVKWAEVETIHRNGIIEGFKVSYGAKGVPFQHKHITSNITRQTTLTELKKYTKYVIQVLAYTRVGDGKCI